jgi:predicted RNase H-like HicB family nuclease
MKQMAYVVYREEEFFVAQCLNVDVSSFGSTREEAVANLKEAVELYFEGESDSAYTLVTDLNVGQELVNA